MDFRKEIEAVAHGDRWKMDRNFRVKAIAAFALDGMSAAQIGGVFCVSRGAVIGLAHREKIKLHNSHDPRPAKERIEAKKVATGGGPKPRPKSRVSPRTMLPKPVISPPQARARINAEFELFDKPGSIHFLNATDARCRAPLWSGNRAPEVSEMRYCGALKENPKRPYCDTCSRTLLLSAAA